MEATPLIPTDHRSIARQYFFLSLFAVLAGTLRQSATMLEVMVEVRLGGRAAVEKESN